MLVDIPQANPSKAKKNVSVYLESAQAESHSHLATPEESISKVHLLEIEHSCGMTRQVTRSIWIKFVTASGRD